MVSQTDEQALESAIERKLTGICLEELKAGGLRTGAADG
jgi:type I restriction enzyme R subunit